MWIRDEGLSVLASVLLNNGLWEKSQDRTGWISLKEAEDHGWVRRKSIGGGNSRSIKLECRDLVKSGAFEIISLEVEQL